MTRSNSLKARWRVVKFGGSSVASSAGWRHIARTVRAVQDEGLGCVLVVSALKGVTDRLEQATQPGADRSATGIRNVADELRLRHAALAGDLACSIESLEPLIEQLCQALREFDEHPDDPRIKARILAFGELFSSTLALPILNALGVGAQWLDSREVLHARFEHRQTSRTQWLSANCSVHLDPELGDRLAACSKNWVAPGFIVSGVDGGTALLGRGGSDVSAALLGTRLGADRVEIHSDVPGLFTADPRRIPAARLLKSISYREATELAAMGAKALHPRALIPLKQHRIPLWLRQTDRPGIEGTRITPDAHEHGAQVKAIVQRRGITLITMEGLDMWQQVGFLADVFGVFRDHGLSVDLVSTSESNVTVTLDPGANPTDRPTLDRLAVDLGRFCQVDIRPDCASVSLVGLGIRTILHRIGPALEVFEQRRIFLVSQAANDLNLSFVVEARHAEKLVQQLHQQIIPGGVGGDSVFGPSWDQLNREARTERAEPAWWRRRAGELLETLGDDDAAFVYALDEVRAAAQRLRQLRTVDRVLYSMKANPHPEILRTVVDEGLGVECVSLAEARHVLEAAPELGPDQLLLTPNFAPRAEYSRGDGRRDPADRRQSVVDRALGRRPRRQVRVSPRRSRLRARTPQDGPHGGLERQVRRAAG
jgi:diaminopimelate decarboxylase/aspartate kinase